LNVHAPSDNLKTVVMRYWNRFSVIFLSTT